MISVTDIDGRLRYLAAGAVARIDEAGPGAQFHGIHAYIRTFDGGLIEVRQTASEVVAAVHAELSSLPAAGRY